MSQNINLLSSEFRKERQPLSLTQVAQGLALTLLVLFAFQFYQQREVNALAAELRTVETSLKEHRARLEKMKGQAVARKPDAQLEAEVARLEAEFKRAQAAAVALQEGVFGNQQGFSEYLRAFSRQALNGLWLTGFTITGTGEIEIRGRVLSPDLVASYIQRLNREAVLAGRSFARFEMNQPKAPPVAVKDKAEKKPPRFLEFSLATTEAARAEGAR
jgi:hypothetical protein